MLGLYVAAVFLGAALLFGVEPFAARQALPLFGGTPAVWNACVMFFQIVLLAGYGYAHLLTRLLPGRAQLAVHACVLAGAAAMPVGLHAGAMGGGAGVWTLLWLLLRGVGPQFFALASAGPLLQRWFSRTGHRTAGDPYFLYAASNAGSLAGLLAYPFVVERVWSLGEQSAWWRGGFVAFGAMTVAAGAVMLVLGGKGRERAAGAEEERSPRLRSGVAAAGEGSPSLRSGLVKTGSPSLRSGVVGAVWRERGWWVLLAFVPSSLLLGVTQYISTDLAAVPLLWVVPLSVYLLTFIGAFSRAGGSVTRIARRLWPIVATAVVVAFLMDARQPLVAIVTLHLLVLACAGALCHGRVRQMCPPVERLTEFYLCIGAGGALGGVFNTLVAPAAFTRLHEYPLAIGLAGLGLAAGRSLRGAWLAVWLAPAALAGWVWASGRLAPGQGIGSGEGHLLLTTGLPALGLFVLSRWRWVFTAATLAVFAGDALAPDPSTVEFRARTFYGVHTVGLDPTGRFRVLAHGTTVHGIESLDPAVRGEPLAYYSRLGPAGSVFATLGGRLGHVAFVGLGAGSLAAYGREGQRLDFFEIDPLVVEIASRPEWFTFVAGSAAEVRFIVGDGRLMLAREADGAYDMIVLDAFSSDAIPVHLLTLEAVELYADKLAPGGVLLMHLSNRHLGLAPLAVAACEGAGLTTQVRNDPQIAEDQETSGRFASEWLLAARDRADFGVLGRDVRWERVGPAARPWTDDRADLVGAIRGPGEDW